MTAKDYPITTPYGWVKDYPLHKNPSDPLVPPDQKSKYPGAGYGFHTGLDYGCPDLTPIVVNGVTIGLSNHTGAAIGAHLHLGRFVNGVVTNPGTSGFSFSQAVVTAVAEDTVNGKYVKLKGDGVDYIYDHLFSQKVKVGQELKGEEIMTWNNGDTYNLLYKSVSANVANQAQKANYVGFFGLQDGMEFSKAFYDIINSLQYGMMVQNAHNTDPSAEILKPGNYKVEG